MRLIRKCFGALAPAYPRWIYVCVCDCDGAQDDPTDGHLVCSAGGGGCVGLGREETKSRAHHHHSSTLIMLSDVIICAIITRNHSLTNGSSNLKKSLLCVFVSRWLHCKWMILGPKCKFSIDVVEGEKYIFFNYFILIFASLYCYELHFLLAVFSIYFVS